LDRFFTTLRRSPVIRSQDRVVAGVSAGVADRLGVSRAIVRVGMVALAIFGPGVFLYLAAWLMLPDSNGQIRLERAVRGGEGGSIALVVVAILAVFSTLFGGAWGDGPGGHHGPGAWPLLFLGGIALIGWKKGWFRGHGRSAWKHGTHAAPAAPTTESTPTTPEGPQDAPKV
jgi:phage shock protein PspC (stress-responsive transcriptional regulator)